jgi:hypothetical protein
VFSPKASPEAASNVFMTLELDGRRSAGRCKPAGASFWAEGVLSAKAWFRKLSSQVSRFACKNAESIRSVGKAPNVDEAAFDQTVNTVTTACRANKLVVEERHASSTA